MTAHRTNDLSIPVDPHDYEQEDLPESTDEFVSLAEAGPANDRTKVDLEDLLEEHAGD